MNNKILERNALQNKLEELRKKGKKIAFTNGCFDILHVGHVRYLREAKKTADVLVLALNSDSSVRLIKGEKRPLMNEKERAEILSALEFVDFITIFDGINAIGTHLLPKAGHFNQGGRLAGRKGCRTGRSKKMGRPGSNNSRNRRKIYNQHCGKDKKTVLLQ